MKAVAVSPGRKEIKVIDDHPEPALAGPNQVKFRILDVGVCGTDREIAAFKYGTPPAGSDYLVIGHESLGEVVEVGDAVTKVAPGDLVVPSVRRPCKAMCPACKAGRQDFCFTGEFTERGINQAHGYMTELVVDDEGVFTKLDSDLREVGVLIEPLTIAEKGLRQVWDVQDRLPWFDPSSPESTRGHDHRAVVFGAGPVSLMGAMALVNRGFQVWVYSLEEAPDPRVEITEAIGATYVSAKQHDMNDLAQQVGRIDLVYEATGAPVPSFKLLEHLGPNGVFILTGVAAPGKLHELDTGLLMRNLVLKNQILLGTVNANRGAFEAASADLSAFNRRWGEALRKVISLRHPIDEAPALLGQSVGGIKHVVQISR